MARRFQVTIDCAEPQRQVRFWAEALHYEAEESGDSIADPEGVGARVFFQQVSEGKSVRNRVRLDIDVTEGRKVPIAVRKEQVDAEAARLVAAGASVFRVLAEEGLDHYAVVMQDPEGNEFCLR